MIKGIIRFVFLTIILGSSTLVFTNAQLQNSITSLGEENSLAKESGLALNLDMDVIIAMVYLLSILGFAILILIDFAIMLRTQIVNLSTTFDSQRTKNTPFSG